MHELFRHPSNHEVQIYKNLISLAAGIREADLTVEQSFVLCLPTEFFGELQACFPKLSCIRMVNGRTMDGFSKVFFLPKAVVKS